jgi:hypothetical protein
MFSASPLPEQTLVVTAESYQLDAVKAVRELASRLNDPILGLFCFFVQQLTICGNWKQKCTELLPIAK